MAVTFLPLHDRGEFRAAAGTRRVLRHRRGRVASEQKVYKVSLTHEDNIGKDVRRSIVGDRV